MQKQISKRPFRMKLWVEDDIDGEQFLATQHVQGNLDDVKPGAMFIVNGVRKFRRSRVLTLTEINKPETVARRGGR